VARLRGLLHIPLRAFCLHRGFLSSNSIEMIQETVCVGEAGQGNYQQKAGVSVIARLCGSSKSVSGRSAQVFLRDAEAS
jgi:hypothetical protein